MLSRRELIRSAALLAGACALPTPLRRAWAQAPANAKPNVLFIAVDDLKPELPCYGATRVLAPNIEKLAASGTVFTSTYCQQAVCAPSRASLLTGCRPDTTNIHDLDHPLQSTSPQLITLPRHFHDNGYRTIGLGKIFHHGLADSGGGYDDTPKYRSRARGRGYVLRENQPAGGERGWGPGGPATERADVPDDAYHDGAMALETVRQLEQLAESRQPFFLSPGFLKPHLPFCAPSKYWDLYKRDEIELAKFRTAPEGTNPIAMHTFGELRAYTGIPPKGELTDDQARELIHGYHACVSYMDAQVGLVLDALQRTGLADNTIVVFWGDHGWHLGDHGLWCKHTNFEQATHSPLIIRVPSTPAGQTCRALVEFVDIFPTLCDLCSMPKPAQLEGDSFVPLLQAPSKPFKKAAFSEFPRGKLLGRSLRTERYRFTRWGTPAARGLDGILELYDYQTDPDETVNLAAKEDQKQLVLEMTAILDAGWKGARPA